MSPLERFTDNLRLKRPLPLNSCNFAGILRRSMHEFSDLLSPLYDALRAQVTMVR